MRTNKIVYHYPTNLFPPPLGTVRTIVHLSLSSPTTPGRAVVGIGIDNREGALSIICGIGGD